MRAAEAQAIRQFIEDLFEIRNEIDPDDVVRLLARQSLQLAQMGDVPAAAVVKPPELDEGTVAGQAFDGFIRWLNDQEPDPGDGWVRLVRGNANAPKFSAVSLDDLEEAWAEYRHDAKVAG